MRKTSNTIPLHSFEGSSTGTAVGEARERKDRPFVVVGVDIDGVVGVDIDGVVDAVVVVGAVVVDVVVDVAVQQQHVVVAAAQQQHVVVGDVCATGAAVAAGISVVGISVVVIVVVVEVDVDDVVVGEREECCDCAKISSARKITLAPHENPTRLIGRSPCTLADSMTAKDEAACSVRAITTLHGLSITS